MHRLLTTGVAAAALLFATAASADVIWTVEGGRIEGEILEEDRRQIKIRSDRGYVVTLARSDIERIERERPIDVFKARLDELDAGDVPALIDLAAWAQEHELPKAARHCYRLVLEVEPDHDVARAELGFRRVDGRWLRGQELREALGLVEYQGRLVTPEERDMLMAGLVQDEDGRWGLPPEEREALDRARRSRRAERSSSWDDEPTASDGDVWPEPEPERRPARDLPEDVSALLRVVKSARDLERREAAIRSLAARGGDLQAALAEELQALYDEAREDLVEHFRRKKGRIRAKLAQRIVARRREALDFIMDPAKYPDANHGAAAQPQVDELVGRLRRAYEDPFREMAEDDDDVAELNEELRRTMGWLNAHGGGDLVERTVAAELTEEIAGIIDMSRFPVSRDDQKVLEVSREVLAYNARVETSLTEEERACVDATNDYRMMFGLKALKVYEPLVQAARKHSVEMNEMGYFAHESPVPANATPAKRCANEGASFTGENIAMGQAQGVPTFWQWYNSSGHHRNILGRHNSIGIGQDGVYWTQVFGSDNP